MILAVSSVPNLDRFDTVFLLQVDTEPCMFVISTNIIRVRAVFDVLIKIAVYSSRCVVTVECGAADCVCIFIDKLD